MRRKLLPACFTLLVTLLWQITVATAQVPFKRMAPKDGTTDFAKGIVLIKFDSRYENLLAARSSDQKYFGIGRLDSALRKWGAKATKQQFALLFDPAFNQQSADNANRGYAAKREKPITAALLEQRHREFGFHLWYQLQFDTTIYLKGILTELQSLKGIVAVAEGVPIARLASSFNDPLYPTQHNLHNTGQGGGTLGKDIDIERAWDVTTGDTNVIVSVNDGAISVNHEDLDSSMWFGKGYNFTDGTPNLVVYEAHATIVAGIVAARNNNGKGISSIAGGNGAAASGVRLMSCQIFDSYGLTNAWATAAFVYAADNGAAISNNSWGDYSVRAKDHSASLADGLSYFTRYGGGAAMKGGLVMWAAGNYNSDLEFSNTAIDVDGTIAVAATNNRDEKASYSNYGDWVDISAPGGDPTVSGGLLSCTYYDVATGTNGYLTNIDGASGTSFATPAVCGVTALVASVAPGRFTADEVMGIVLNTADDIDSLNPGYEGKLGSGRVNAYKAVLKAQQMAALPLLDTVSNVVVNRTCNGYTVGYTKNAVNNDVMIAYGLSRKFNLPNGNVYNVGDSIGHNAIVVYKGPATSFVINRILKDSARHYIKIWSVNGSNYSSGTVVHADSSFYTLRNPSAIQGANEVAISFGKACPNSDVLVVVNTLPQFGVPKGSMPVGDVMADGGTVLYKGSAAGFTHVGLTSGSYYYALYPVINHQYGESRFLGGFCFGTTGALSFFKTSFETPDVPQNLALFNPSQDGLGWQITNSIAGHTGTGAAFTKNFYNYEPGKMGAASYLQTTPLNVGGADSIICRFAHAYRAYDTSSSAGNYYSISTIHYQDTLSLLISTDCGRTWQTAWQRGGIDLTTMQPDADFFNEGAPVTIADWATNKVNITSLIPAGTESIVVAFKNTNRAGRNIYVDDINIHKVVHNDAGIAAIISPNTEACSVTFSPKVVLQNFGISPLSTTQVHYKIDNGAVQTINWTGHLAYEQTDTLLLTAVTLSPGNHSLAVFTGNPNSLIDGVPDNDTAVANFKVIPTHSIALNTTYKESFETPVTVPEGWTVADPHNAYTWQRVDRHYPLLEDLYAIDDTSAMVVITAYDDKIGAVHDLYTPPFNTGNADTVKFTFSRAAFALFNPGNTTDKLDVLLTTDCGETFTNIYSKTGTELATSQTPNQYQPLSAADWKSDTIDVSNLVRNVANYRFVFRVTNGYELNVFIDNMQVHSKQAPIILPLQLVSFTGRLATGSSALLSWRTTNEINTAYFELQRSIDGRSFAPVAQLPTKGNSSSATDYQYVDASLKPGLYYYRLRMVDKDGKESFSQVVSVSFAGNMQVLVYPIPAKDRVWLSGSSSLIGKTGQLTDMQGRVLQKIRIGILPQSIDIPLLVPGMYLLKIADEAAVKIQKE